MFIRPSGRVHVSRCPTPAGPPDLSEKALISQRSSSSSGTHVSITTGPVCLAGSCFFGRKALERSPFL